MNNLIEAENKIQKENEILNKKLNNLRKDLVKFERGTIWQRIQYLLTGRVS